MKRLLVVLVLVFMLVSPVSAGMLIPVNPWNAQIDIGLFYSVPLRLNGEYDLGIVMFYKGPSKKLFLNCNLYFGDGYSRTFLERVLPGINGIQYTYKTVVANPYLSYLFVCEITDGIIVDTVWMTTPARTIDTRLNFVKPQLIY